MTAALLLLASLAAAQPSPCETRYEDSFQADWGLSREGWRAACGRGLKPDDILRPAQRASIDACQARYAGLEAAGKTPSGTVASYCAQGQAGRARLGALAGETPPAPASGAPAAVVPGRRNMGPAARSLAIARRDYKADACWSGFYYAQEPSDLTAKVDFDLLARDPAHGVITPRKVVVEQYSYYFASPTAGTSLYRVTTGDSLMPYACYPDDAEKFENGWALDVPGFHDCLGVVAVDLRRALALASERGVLSNADLKAYLGTFPEGFFSSERCVVSFGDHKTPCAQSGWDQGKLRRATGKIVWIVSAGRTAVIDAARERVYFSGSGELSLDGVVKPYSIGIPCHYTPGLAH